MPLTPVIISSYSIIDTSINEFTNSFIEYVNTNNDANALSDGLAPLSACEEATKAVNKNPRP